MTEHRRKAEEEERRFMELAESDPFNPEVQVWVGSCSCLRKVLTWFVCGCWS